MGRGDAGGTLNDELRGRGGGRRRGGQKSGGGARTGTKVSKEKTAVEDREDHLKRREAVKRERRNVHLPERRGCFVEITAGRGCDAC